MKPCTQITIGPDGSVEVEAKGIKGQGCEALTKAFEDGLGAVTGDRKKPEYHQHEHEPNRQRAGQ